MPKKYVPDFAPHSSLLAPRVPWQRACLHVTHLVTSYQTPSSLERAGRPSHGVNPSLYSWT
jgi:hypothetical protein